MKISNKRFVRAAREMYQDDGTLEVDDGAKVSRASAKEGGIEAAGGAYVAVWVWVPLEAFEEK